MVNKLQKTIMWICHTENWNLVDAKCDWEVNLRGLHIGRNWKLMRALNDPKMGELYFIGDGKHIKS